MGKKYLPGMYLGPNKTLLKERTKRVGNNYYGIFVCSLCGKEFETRISQIVNGTCKSCGCLNNKQRQILGKSNAKDLTNQRFGKLIALEPTDLRQQRKIKWKCQCDCGNIVYITSSDLLTGHTKSCGCLRSGGELQIQNILKQNNINFEKEKIFNDCRNPKTNNCLRFDFYLPEKNICIECHGMQHYHEIEYFGGEKEYQHRKYLDELKEKYCKENNIDLIIIPYKNYADIKEDEILSKIA